MDLSRAYMKLIFWQLKVDSSTREKVKYDDFNSELIVKKINFLGIKSIPNKLQISRLYVSVMP